MFVFFTKMIIVVQLCRREQKQFNVLSKAKKWPTLKNVLVVQSQSTSSQHASG